MQPPKSLTCVICGVRPATTDEHVPPRGFFKGVSGQFRTVPACYICNNGSSEDDEVLRNYISAQVGKQTESAKILWEKGAHKSLKRNTKIRSKLSSTLQEIQIVDENGASTTRLAFLVPVGLYQCVFERVTRGLYFHHTGEILPPETPVKINLLNNAPDLSMQEMLALEQHSICGSAFEYRFGLDPEDSNSGVWLFAVHNAHWVQSSTGAFADESF